LRAIIILAGGQSSRFGRDKALADFAGKPLIAYITHKLQNLGDECVVSIGRNDAADDYRRVLPSNIIIVQDSVDFQGPLAGFISALEGCKSEFCFLAACDMPSIEPNVVRYLFRESANSSGAIPKWRDGKLEPLHAVYDCNATRHAAQQVISEQTLSMVSLIDHMPRIRFVSVEDVIAPLDPTLNTFRNLNTPRDLEKLEDQLGEQPK
jgi:molybdopterin-guanine dinucleotide biosynthesis protein A